MTDTNNDTTVTSTTEIKTNAFMQYLTKRNIILLVVLCLMIGFVYAKYGTIEGQAKNCVSSYLGAIKAGKDTSKYKDVSVDDFINILNYKYLNVKEKTKEKYTMTTTRDEYDDYFKQGNDNKSFKEYKREQKEIYNQINKSGEGVISETDNSITIWGGDYYDRIVLMYDVSLTNKLGTQLFKKIYFTVDNKNPDHKMKVSSSDY